jgi:ankyrin repeat protein
MDDCFSPIGESIRIGHIAIVKTLMSNGANILDGENMANDSIIPALYDAVMKGHLDTIKEIFDHGPSADTFLGAPFCHLMFLRCGDLTFLECAALTGHLEIVKYFLDLSSNNVKYGNQWNRMLLLSAFEGHVAVVEELISRKLVDVDKALQIAECNSSHFKDEEARTKGRNAVQLLKAAMIKK